MRVALDLHIVENSYEAVWSVVKVKGNAGKRRSWAPKIAGERSETPHSR